MNREARTRDDGPGSFDRLYAAETPTLVALAVALLGNRELAREVVQEAALRAFRDWPRVSRLDRPGAWVRRVTINLAIDVHRRRGREARALSLIASGDSVFTDPDVAEFWRIVRDLPPRQRTAVTLRYVEDLSIESIAEVMAVSAGTVTKLLFTARHTLAVRLSTEEDSG